MTTVTSAESCGCYARVFYVLCFMAVLYVLRLYREKNFAFVQL